MIEDYRARNLQIKFLQSSIGDGAHDITVDWRPTILPTEYIVLVAASQNQDVGVANNVGLFLCSQEMQPILPEGGPNSSILAPNGSPDPNLLGVFINSDGSTTLNWGSIFPSDIRLGGMGLPIGPQWFVRFTTWTGATNGFPANKSRFRIHLIYYIRPLCGE